MLRIKKISNSIFPREFTKALLSYDKSYQKEIESIKNEQRNNLKDNFEKKLLSLQEKVEVETESERAIKIKKLIDCIDDCIKN